MEALAIRALVLDFQKTLVGSRIEKIHQPNDRELVFTLRSRKGTERLLISAHKEYARIYLLRNQRPENPETPPMFCMVLRKRIEGGRIAQVRQQGWDRVIEFVIETLNELGDKETYILVCEIMGKNSNIILCHSDDNQPKRIVDAIVHVTSSMSRFRQVLPGLDYEMPPRQEKAPFAEASEHDVAAIDTQSGVSKRNIAELIKHIAGVGPITAREILARAQSKGVQNTDSLLRALKNLFHAVLNETEPASIGLDELGKPIEYAPFLLTSATKFQEVADLSSAIEQVSQDITRTVKQSAIGRELAEAVAGHIDRLRGKLNKLAELEQDSKNHEEFRIYGELLTAYAFQVSKGQAEARLPNFYDEGKMIRISLDPALSPIENAQRYFKQSSKRKRSITILAAERERTESDLAYLENVQSHLTEASYENLLQIRAELQSEGFLKAKAVRKKQKSAKKSARPSPQKPDSYRSQDGFIIYVGRNNAQNDRLTLKTSNESDIWLHVKDQPGSHVVIQSHGRRVPESTLSDAALLAVYFSRARESANVPVDYTEIRHVWKPNGARPGHVLYDNQKTLFVTPDRTLIEPLLKTRATISLSNEQA